MVSLLIESACFASAAGSSLSSVTAAARTHSRPGVSRSKRRHAARASPDPAGSRSNTPSVPHAFLHTHQFQSFRPKAASAALMFVLSAPIGLSINEAAETESKSARCPERRCFRFGGREKTNCKQGLLVGAAAVYTERRFWYDDGGRVAERARARLGASTPRAAALPPHPAARGPRRRTVAASRLQHTCVGRGSSCARRG